MVFAKSVRLSTSFLLLVSLSCRAETDPAVQDAQNQSAIATAMANASIAQAAAQQTLAASQLANEKNELALIQSAFQAPDPGKLRTVTNLTAPVLNAAYYRILSERMNTWLDQPGNDNTPVSDLGACKVVFAARPSLLTAVQLYRATDAKLYALWKNLTDASASLTKPAAPTFSGQPHVNFAALATVGAASAVASLVASFAAAAKNSTAAGTQTMSNAGRVVFASIAQKVPTSGRDYYDADGVIGEPYDSPVESATCAATPGAFVSKLPLADKASCVGIALEKARSVAAAVNINPAPADPKTADPDKEARARLADVNKLISQSNSEFQALFTVDASTGIIPYNLATQGDKFNALLKSANTCILSANVISSDADTVVRDGTFSSYKLALATTTTLNWTVSQPDGKILKSGFKALSTDWKRQEMDK